MTIDLQTPHVLANDHYHAADGTDAQGRPDISQAIARAAVVADANGSGIVAIAPRIGGYSWGTQVTLASIARPLTIVAPGMAAQITPNMGGGGTMLTMSGVTNTAALVTIEGMAIIGNSVGTDTAQVLATSADLWLLMNKCVFVGIQTGADMFSLSVAKLSIRNCLFGGLSASGNAWLRILGGVWGIDIKDNIFGVGLSGTPVKSNTADTCIHLLGDSPGTQAEGVIIELNVFAAAVARTIWADPVPTLFIDLLELIRNEFLPGPSLALDAHDCFFVRGIGNTFAMNSGGTFPNIETRCTGNVDTWYFDQNFFHFGPPFIAADLTGVRNATFARNQGFAIGTGITLRAGVIELNLLDNDGPLGAHLTIAAGIPRVYEYTNGLWQNTFGPCRFIDPANSTGFASDSNTGATNNNVPAGSGPILTTKHLNGLIYQRTLTVDTTITYMSDDTSGTPLTYSTLDTNGFQFILQGTPQLLHTGGTLNAGTIAINPAAGGGGQRQTAHTTDIADFTPFVWSGNGGTAPHPAYLNDTTGGNAGTKAWIVKNVGATASLSWPATPGMAQGALTIGDSYTLRRGSILLLSAMSQPVGLGSVEFFDFALDAASIGAPFSVYTRCSFEGVLACGGFFQQCYVGAGIDPDSGVHKIALISASVLISVEGNNQFAGTFIIGDGLYLTGDTFEMSTSVFPNPFIAAGGFSSDMQVQDMTAQGLLVGGVVFINGFLVWGNGNTSPGLTVKSGSVTVPSTVGEVPSVTGAGGDFAFVSQNGGALVGVARAFDPTTGAYTEAGGVATRTTTWAHFAASLAGGGFNFQAHDGETGAALIGI